MVTEQIVALIILWHIDDEVVDVGVVTDVVERVVDEVDQIRFDDVDVIDNDINDEIDEKVVAVVDDDEVEPRRLDVAPITDVYIVGVLVESDTSVVSLETRYITEVVEADEAQDVYEIYQQFAVDDVDDVEGLDVHRTDEMQQRLEVDEVEYDVDDTQVDDEKMVYL